MPRPSAPIPPMTAAKDSTVQPVKVRPFSSKLIDTSTGRVLFSLAASRAARASCRSVIVSMTMRSALSRPARTMQANCSTASSKSNVPDGASSSPRGPMSSATHAPDARAASRATSSAAPISCGAVQPLPSSLRRLAPKVLA